MPPLPTLLVGESGETSSGIPFQVRLIDVKVGHIPHPESMDYPKHDTHNCIDLINYKVLSTASQLFQGSYIQPFLQDNQI